MTYPDAHGTILVEICDTDREANQSILIWKDSADFDRDPLEAYGKLRVLCADREKLGLIEALISHNAD